MNKKFNLVVNSREGTVFRGEVDSITSFNEQGKFDILAHHANFISLIQKSLIIRYGGEKKEIPFGTALLRTKRNNVEVYIGLEGVRNLESAQFLRV